MLKQFLIFDEKAIRTIIVTVIISIFVGLVGFIVALSVIKISLVDMLLKVMPQHHLISQMNVLVIGVDETGDSQRADTIIVANFNPHTNHIGLISIPRDTRVYIPGYGMDKINHSYMYGGIKLVQQSAASFLKIPIPYYIAINMAGVSKVIDQVGGVEIDVDKRMYYVDRAGDLFIDLYPGKQVLDGRKAMGYVRFRNDESGDIGRAKRQQSFVKAVGKSVLRAGLLSKAPFIIKQLGENLKTNLSARQIVTIAIKMRKGFEEGKLDMATVPGYARIVDGLSYWIPELDETTKMVNKVINDFEYISPENFATAQAGTFTNSSALKQPQEMKVEVLNGTFQEGLALKGAEFLRNNKYVVPWIGDATNKDNASTMVVNWRGSKLAEEAKRLAKLFGVSSQRIIQYDYPKKEVDFTVVIGKNWP